MRNIVLIGRRSRIYGRLERHKEQSPSLRFRDQNSALKFLRSAGAHGANMISFRAVLAASTYGSNLHLKDDQAALNELSKLLISGRIVVYQDEIKVRPMQSTESSIALTQTVKRRSKPRSVPAKKPRRAPAPKPAAKTNVDQQVATLLAAAKGGAPFCEKCERARLEREAA